MYCCPFHVETPVVFLLSMLSFIFCVSSFFYYYLSGKLNDHLGKSFSFDFLSVFFALSVSMYLSFLLFWYSGQDMRSDCTCLSSCTLPILFY